MKNNDRVSKFALNLIIETRFMTVINTHDASFHNPIWEQLALIREKRFTNREIDIIACLLCGRSRAISSFLSIAPKTVETHIRNIMLKIECNSREGIIDFIEKSDKFLLIRAYYQTLAITQTFEKILKEKLPFIKRQATVCKISFDTSLLDRERIFINHLNKHLNLLNISTTINPCEKHSINEHISIAKTDNKNESVPTIYIFASNSNLPIPPPQFYFFSFNWQK